MDLPETPEWKALVQVRFARVAPIADLAAELFYEDVLTRNPALRLLFKAVPAEQRKRLGTEVVGCEMPWWPATRRSPER